MAPRTTSPICDACGVIVTLIVPVCPGPSTSRFAPLSVVLVPNTRSCQRSPLSEETVPSKALSCATALVWTGVVGAPAGPNGPTSVGAISHCPQGTSGSVSDAATVFGPIDFAVRSGAPVKPKRKPVLPKASMVIGAGARAVNCALRVCVGSNVPKQAKGSSVAGGGLKNGHTTGAVPNARVVRVSRRASTKYAWANPPLFVTVIGTLCGPALTESSWVGLFGKPVAFTSAVSKPICAVKGSEVWLPEVK